MALRFGAALFIVQGAVNPAGIALTLHESCKECIAEGKRQAEDPAIRLMVHQLASLCNVERTMEIDEYRSLLDQCEATLPPPEGVKAVDYEAEVIQRISIIDLPLADMEADDLKGLPEPVDTAVQEGTMFERAFGDGNDTGG